MVGAWILIIPWMGVPDHGSIQSMPHNDTLARYSEPF